MVRIIIITETRKKKLIKRGREHRLERSTGTHDTKERSRNAAGLIERAPRALSRFVRTPSSGYHHLADFRGGGGSGKASKRRRVCTARRGGAITAFITSPSGRGSVYLAKVLLRADMDCSGITTRRRPADARAHCTHRASTRDAPRAVYPTRA